MKTEVPSWLLEEMNLLVHGQEMRFYPENFITANSSYLIRLSF